VDRFLARRGGDPVALHLTDRARAGARATAGAITAAPTPAPVGFVCEATCATPSRKTQDIHRPRTIVTPSARDLASPSDILVLVQA